MNLLAPKRRWYQFNLRTMFVVVTILCVGPGGYVAYEQHKSRRGNAALAAIETLGGRINYDMFLGNEEIPTRSATMKFLLGDDRYAHATVASFWKDVTVRDITDRDLDLVIALPNLNDLRLESSQITNAGLERLVVELPGLRALSLENAQITDEGLECLTKLKNLEHLDLGNVKATDAGLAHLSHLTSLWHLDLSGTRITDAGLAHLSRLNVCGITLTNTPIGEVGAMHVLKIDTLTVLYMDDCAVTEEGAKRLERARRDVNIGYRHTAGDDAPLVRRGERQPEMR